MQISRSTLIGAAILVCGVALCVPTRAAADNGGCHHRIRASVMALLDSGISGKAKLCINDDGVSGTLELEHLRRRHAYTVWFAYFDDPSKCVGGGPGVCSDADFGGLKPLGVFGRYDSGIGPADGEEDFEGRVRGLRPRRGSQVWLIVFVHGRADTADGSHLARQLLTPEDPDAGAPHLGNVIDGPRGMPAAVAVFNIP